jgi:hypothetical protein
MEMEDVNFGRLSLLCVRQVSDIVPFVENDLSIRLPVCPFHLLLLLMSAARGVQRQPDRRNAAVVRGGDPGGGLHRQR